MWNSNDFVGRSFRKIKEKVIKEWTIQRTPETSLVYTVKKTKCKNYEHFQLFKSAVQFLNETYVKKKAFQNKNNLIEQFAVTFRKP